MFSIIRLPDRSLVISLHYFLGTPISLLAEVVLVVSLRWPTTERWSCKRGSRSEFGVPGEQNPDLDCSDDSVALFPIAGKTDSASGDNEFCLRPHPLSHDPGCNLCA